jgi:hypothetical protein
MKNKTTKEEKKLLWEEMLKNNTTQDEQNEFSKPIQDFIFNNLRSWTANYRFTN